MICEWGYGKMCRSFSQGRPGLYVCDRVILSTTGIWFFRPGTALTMVQLALCVYFKSMGELGDQFDFSFKPWIS